MNLCAVSCDNINNKRIANEKHNKDVINMQSIQFLSLV